MPTSAPFWERWAKFKFGAFKILLLFWRVGAAKYVINFQSLSVKKWCGGTKNFLQKLK
jgi:hypothetical protein